MISNFIVQLILRLQATNSPREKLDLINSFCLDHYDELSPEDIKSLREAFTKAVEVKRLQGEAAIKKRVYKKKKRKSEGTTYAQPMFTKSYGAKQLCETCNQLIDSSNAFRWMRDGSYLDYHALPECFPEDERALFMTNQEYQKAMMPKLEE